VFLYQLVQRCCDQPRIEDPFQPAVIVRQHFLIERYFPRTRIPAAAVIRDRNIAGYGVQP